MALVIVAAAVLVVFLIVKNNRDRKDYERYLNDDPTFRKDEDEPNDPS